MNTCTCFKLRKLTRTASRFYDAHLARSGMKTTQYSLLRAIGREPTPMAELGRRLAIERTTLTRNLKPLADAGWITIEPGSDARQRIVALTAGGRAAIATAKQAWRRAQDALEQALGARSVEALHQQLDRALLILTPLVERNPDVVNA